ncbi:GNAT family N-acetyltransferase [Haliangium ochraceum]|uniref:GCN5-related N-acetyltransferase n=1 Tax=Haliangium ochraceum (strain DSM 14365 / JCM 11303 / SMP-2) TaxID=502025 RepID=D0LW92_HALO1|nr:GNAT family N-acetyltransferase [Haliangium ochraceum]ACY16024.1 GCN5-related N-acetyltransferase [Haliangium ochraceum DSM 14365]
MSRLQHIGDLHLTRDKPAVYAWLRAYLSWHLEVWARALGVALSPAELEDRIDRGGLLEREWDELARASQDEEQFVAVAREGMRAVGIVHAAARHDRYLELPIGALYWIFVEPVSRGAGASDLLMDAARGWMRARGLRAAEVFVSEDNAPALRLYQRHGYRGADLRMLARLGDGEPRS